jgi:hypothetical protein
MKKLLSWTAVVATPIALATVSHGLPKIAAVLALLGNAFQDPSNQNLLNLIVFNMFSPLLCLIPFLGQLIW